jgi:hypothetical protein
MGMMKNMNKKKRTTQSTPISKGYVKIPPLAFGLKECAIKPWIPMLKRAKIRLDMAIKKTFECISLIVFR